MRKRFGNPIPEFWLIITAIDGKSDERKNLADRQIFHLKVGLQRSATAILKPICCYEILTLEHRLSII